MAGQRAGSGNYPRRLSAALRSAGKALRAFAGACCISEKRRRRGRAAIADWF